MSSSNGIDSDSAGSSSNRRCRSWPMSNCNSRGNDAHTRCVSGRSIIPNAARFFSTHKREHSAGHDVAEARRAWARSEHAGGDSEKERGSSLVPHLVLAGGTDCRENPEVGPISPARLRHLRGARALATIRSAVADVRILPAASSRNSQRCGTIVGSSARLGFRANRRQPRRIQIRRNHTPKLSYCSRLLARGSAPEVCRPTAAGAGAAARVLGDDLPSRSSCMPAGTPSWSGVERTPGHRQATARQVGEQH